MSDASDALLGPDKGASSPSYGINEAVGEKSDSAESQKSGIRETMQHSKDRFWVVAAYALIACMGSMVAGGFTGGYTSSTLLRLEDIYDEGDSDHGFKQDSFYGSLFGVSSDHQVGILVGIS